MKFTYWLSRIFGTTTLLIISILGLAVVAGVIVVGYFIKDDIFITGIVTQLNEVLNGLKTAGDAIPPGGGVVPPIDNDLVLRLEQAIEFLNSNKALVIGIGTGAFIGGIVFASIFVISIILWMCFSSTRKRAKEKQKEELLLKKLRQQTI